LVLPVPLFLTLNGPEGTLTTVSFNKTGTAALLEIFILSAVNKISLSLTVNITGLYVNPARVPLKYDEVRSFNDGYVQVMLDNKWGFVNKQGKEVVTPKYDKAYAFYNGFACVSNNNKWGFIDKTGKTVISFEYDYVGN